MVNFPTHTLLPPGIIVGQLILHQYSANSVVLLHCLLSFRHLKQHWMVLEEHHGLLQVQEQAPSPLDLSCER